VRLLAAELGEHGVKVNGINPDGVVRGSENVANAVLLLCTSDLSHTTGLHIPVDAGVAAAFRRY
jgi:enoyl-[acyl-carrier-protein] reductase (NADH)